MHVSITLSYATLYLYNVKKESMYQTRSFNNTSVSAYISCITVLDEMIYLKMLNFSRTDTCKQFSPESLTNLMILVNQLSIWCQLSILEYSLLHLT